MSRFNIPCHICKMFLISHPIQDDMNNSSLPFYRERSFFLTNVRFLPYSYSLFPFLNWISPVPHRLLFSKTPNKHRTLVTPHNFTKFSSPAFNSVIIATGCGWRPIFLFAFVLVLGAYPGQKSPNRQEPDWSVPSPAQARASFSQIQLLPTSQSKMCCKRADGLVEVGVEYKSFQMAGNHWDSDKP